MAKVKIEGNASGTGTFTIAAPNSNTDRTLTLPDEAGTVLTSAGAGTDYLTPTGDGSGLTGIAGGLTEADVWRLSANYTSGGSYAYMTTNWERADESSFGKIGTGMTESSGVFTFPSTGVWAISAFSYRSPTGSGSYAEWQLFASTDGGSNFNSIAYADAGADASGRRQTVSLFAFINVSGTASNYQCKFRAHSGLSGDMVYTGATDQNLTAVSFIRLGDSV